MKLFQSIKEKLRSAFSKRAFRIIFYSLVATILFVAACVHVHKVNKLYLENSIGHPFLVVLVTL